MENIQVELVNVVILLIAGLVGVISKYTTAFLKKKGILAQLQSNKEIVNIVVNAVEQTYKHLKGSEKFDKAKLDILKLAKSKGVKISDKELNLLIESSVKEMKKSFKEESK